MNLRFLFEYLKDIRSVGAVAPSSRFLARKMVESIDFTRAEVIMEYGPGTGVFTAEIVKRMKPGATLLVFETNDAFYRKLRAEYEGVNGVEIINTSAEDADAHRKDRALPKPDYIISGLPFAALPVQVAEKILHSTAALLNKDGEFITFQYTLLKKGFIESYFNSVTVTRELKNIPPAYVLRCR